MFSFNSRLVFLERFVILASVSFALMRAIPIALKANKRGSALAPLKEVFCYVEFRHSHRSRGRETLKGVRKDNYKLDIRQKARGFQAGKGSSR
jgi:hypothetical protein